MTVTKSTPFAPETGPHGTKYRMERAISAAWRQLRNLFSPQPHQQFTTKKTSKLPSVAHLTAAMSLFLLCACQKNSQYPHEATTLRIALSVEIESLDPQISSSIDAIKVQSALFETLVRLDAQTHEPVPAGALAWEVSPDGLHYLFELDPELHWSDGTPVVAKDYVFAFERLLHPELGSPFSGFYQSLLNTPANGENDETVRTAVRATGSHTLEMSLNRPTPHFFSLLARPCAAALPRKWIEKHGAVHTRVSQWSRIPGFPASGPYRLRDWVINKGLTLDQNPYYPRRTELDFDTLLFLPLESAYTQEQALLSTSIDVTSNIASERIARYNEDARLVSTTEMGTFYIIVNMQSPALQNKQLRQALGGAIDRDLIVRKIRRRGESTAQTFTPPLWPSYQVPVHKEILQLEKVETPSRPLVLLIPSSPNNQQIAEALQSMWHEQLPGLQIVIERKEWKAYLDSRNRGQFDLCMATWIGDYLDPLAFLEMWRSNSANNFARWNKPRYDALLSKAEEKIDQRLVYLAQAEGLLLETHAILPVYHLSRVYLKSENIKSWPQNLLNTVDYTLVRRNSH